jgi:transcriptional regulator with XRE-family HTH domain
MDVLFTFSYRHDTSPLIQKGSYAMIQKGSSPILKISIEQLRAARGLLGWSQSKLADRAALSLPTVKRLEGGFGPRVSADARAKLKRALEDAGVEFIDENGGGPGVRLKRTHAHKERD